ncbi:MAG: hypothetical protein AAFN11_00960 [Chloroflexota bacterium]
MTNQLKLFQQTWQSMTLHEQWSIGWRILASVFVIMIGIAVIFSLRANTIGEDGSSLAMYSLGALFVLLGNLLIFTNKLRFPEQFALKSCIAVIIFCATWVNIEENVVLPLLTSTCETDCLRVYERQIPFASSYLVYQDEGGWQLRK